MKNIFSLSVILTVFFVAGLMVHNYNLSDIDPMKQDYDYSFELNINNENLSDEFVYNQMISNKISYNLFEALKADCELCADPSIYTVNLIRAIDYPDYFGGMYINTDGKLVIQIKNTYYDNDYRYSEWYSELKTLLQSDNFACYPVKYSYGELMNAASEVMFGGKAEELIQNGLDVYLLGNGLDDYRNKVVVDINNQEFADEIRSVLDSDIYEINVYEGGNSLTTGVYPGIGVTKNNTGAYEFSVGCRARRYSLVDGHYEYGFITCGHAFSGTSNVYLPSNGTFNTYIGYSPSSLQAYYGNSDAAFVITGDDVTLYNNVYMETTTLYNSYGVLGSVVYKKGATSGLTTGNVLDSSYNEYFEGAYHTDFVKTSYYAYFGDSGCIVYTQPNSQLKSYPLGLQSAINHSGETVYYSMFCKIDNAVFALQKLQYVLEIY